MPPKATTKYIAPASPPKGHFFHFQRPGTVLQWWFEFPFTATCPTFGQQSLCPPWRQHGRVCPHTAAAPVHSQPFGPKPSDTGGTGSSKRPWATATGRAALPEPEATLFGRNQATPPLCLGWDARTRPWPLYQAFSWSLGENQHKHWLPNPWGGAAFPPHQQLKLADVQRETPAWSNIQSIAANRWRVSIVLPVCLGCENSTSFYFWYSISGRMQNARCKGPEMKETLSCLASQCINSQCWDSHGYYFKVGTKGLFAKRLPYRTPYHFVFAYSAMCSIARNRPTSLGSEWDGIDLKQLWIPPVFPHTHFYLIFFSREVTLTGKIPDINVWNWSVIFSCINHSARMCPGFVRACWNVSHMLLMVIYTRRESCCFPEIIFLARNFWPRTFLGMFCFPVVFWPSTLLFFFFSGNFFCFIGSFTFW